MELQGVTKFEDMNQPTFAKQTLGKEEFMTLLLKQLSYQDPLNPLDNTEFTAQLTQFSSLEELSNINSTLEDVLTFQHSMQNAAVTNMIGKSVELDGNSIYLNDTAELSYALSDTAKTVNITLLDQNGIAVRTEEIGQQSEGWHTYHWDGKDDFGNKVAEGSYTFEIEPFDGQGNLVGALSSSTGTVTGIIFEDSMTYLELDGGRHVYLSDIKSITQ